MGGEAAEDEDQDMVYEDGHFVSLVGGLLLHLDEDQVERGCVRELVNNHMEASFILGRVKKGIKSKNNA